MGYCITTKGERGEKQKGNKRNTWERWKEGKVLVQEGEMEQDRREMKNIMKENGIFAT